MTGKVVLVPLDGSKVAHASLPLAEHLAGLHGVSVRRLELTNSAEGARQGGGTAADTIIKAAADEDACLIVMGADAAGPGPGGEIGAATLAVLQKAACPVVLVNPASPARDDWDLKRVLGLHDGSPSASLAMRPVAELARRAGAELVVLHAPGAEQATESGSIAPPMYVDQRHHTWPVWTDEFQQRLASLCPMTDVQVRLRVGGGDPAEEASRLAREDSTDLIALAWTADGKARSTVEAMLRDAPCPIMVTRISAA